MHNFRELKVWQKARYLVKDIYHLTRNFPPEENFVLTRQIRKSVVSIPSNIAEGCGRGSDPQLMHFLGIAMGSSCELETQLILAVDLAYLKETNFNEIISKINEIQKMIIGFKTSLLK